jgi:hypothetical protein
VAAGLDQLGLEASDLDADVATANTYDVGVWAAGYEQRSSWLVTSNFKPANVGEWLRVEFEEDRTAHSAPDSLSVGLGTILGGRPGKRGWDGHWLVAWRQFIERKAAALGRPVRMFCDYSSMPRTVYGTLLLNALTACRGLVDSITLAYVPGIHGPDVDGSRSIEGLRALVGTEGQTVHDQSPAFILGLGFDGVLAESILELFQVASFGCFYGNPGVYPDSVDRAVRANEFILPRAELVVKAPAWSIEGSLLAIQRLRTWFNGRDVLLVPLGPKPHIIGSILASVADPTLALRFPDTSKLTPVQVTVAADARLRISVLRFR